MIKNLIILLFFILNLEGKILNLTIKEKEYIKNNPIVLAHNEKNWPPFNFNENGVPLGYSIDYINLLASKVGLNINFISGYSWTEYMQMLQTPKLDLIVNISKNDLRSKTIEFTDVFLSVKNAIYININKKKFKKLDELKYHTIAMPKDFYAQKFLEEKYPSIKQILVDDQLSALKLLSEGKVDATVGKKVVLDYIIQKNAINNVASTEYLREEKIISHMRIGSSKEDKILINILKKAQQQITREEKNKLNFKWLGLNEFNNNNNNNNNNVFSDKINEYIKKKKKLSLCVNSNNLPIERLDENIYEGISSDYIKIFEEKINLPINLISTKSYIESLSKLTTNECDIATSLPKLMSNEKYINYIYPYIDAQILIASKIDNVYIDNLATYIDKVFVIKDEFIYNIVKNKYPNIKLLKTNTVVEALDLVHQEKAFAYLGDSLSLSYTIQKNYLGIISISGKLEESISYSISIRNNDKILEELIKTITSKIYTSDKIDIESKWLKFKENILIDYSLVIKVIIAFILIIVILFFYQKQKKLKSKIELLNKKLKIKVKKEIEINKQKDETIFKQAKLISMGEMVNNIAHQWRQPLSEVNSIVMNLEKDFYSNKMNKISLENNLSKIEKLTEYMSNTIENFHNFFLTNKETKNLLISKHIYKVLNLFENSFSKAKIKIDLNIKNDIKVKVYEGELSQVLIIILQNAKDAFIINNISNRLININIIVNNNKLLISIEDNAGGIKKDIISKIFEPYFSTKRETQGIGLGLYLSKQIIEKSMKGKLEVSSISNTSKFAITLPFE